MKFILYILLVVIVTSCSVGRSSYSPFKKYSPAQLQKDYGIYEQILEEAHPGLYWYTSKDSMDHYFKMGKALLNDSLTEPEFRKILTYVTAKINCGHTSVRSSRAYNRFVDTARIFRVFPLSMKLWNDTVVVAANLQRRDSTLVRGTQIKKINGVPVEHIIDTLFDYLSTDGYNTTHKYQVLSNRGFFGSLYSSLFGYSLRYNIEYVDSTGQLHNTLLPVYFPVRDTASRAALKPVVRIPKPSRKDQKKQQLNSVRLLKVDTANHTAMMDLSSFGRGYGLRSFFKRSFKLLEKKDIGHLIIDVRGNGGGSVTNSTLISKYISDHPFKVGDSLYAIARRKTYSRYIKGDFFNRLFISLFAHKRKDGLYHFGYFEKHYFKPKKNHHFDGKTYILTGGNSFSATTLFVSSIKAQDNVVVVGEETGGGAYGNSAWLIPDVTLPVTGVRFRLPLFRLVIDKTVPKNGRGVQPEIFAGPTIDAVRRGADYKLDKVMELIKQEKIQNEKFKIQNSKIDSLKRARYLPVRRLYF